MSNSIARHREVEIGGVEDRRQAAVPDELVKLFASMVEKRAEDSVPTRCDSSETCQTAAEGEPKQHGFYLIVSVVGGQDERGTGMGANLLEKGVANAPGRSFQALSGLLQESYSAPLCPDRDIQFLADTRSVVCSSTRILVETMVQMSRGQIETQRGSDRCRGCE
jgi:hypothetical protein